MFCCTNVLPPPLVRPLFSGRSHVLFCGLVRYTLAPMHTLQRHHVASQSLLRYRTPCIPRVLCCARCSCASGVYNHDHKIMVHNHLSHAHYYHHPTVHTKTELLSIHQVRCIHVSSVFRDKEAIDPDAKSKAERTLQLLREELQEEATKASDKKNAVVVKKTIWQKVVAECKHYYHGFRLLGIEFRISAKLLWQVMRGHTLTRRERKQLVRSVSDMFRLVPFSVFVIVPFMEFTLPIFLKLFPNLLPSTFAEKSKEEEKIRRQLKAKLEMAKFLQASLEELALHKKSQQDERSSKAQEFGLFLKKARTEGAVISNDELLKFSKVFEDELTLDNLSASQLRALCKIVSIQPIGPPNILRFQLMLKLRDLKADDRMISKEGIYSLSVAELQAACRARGMRAVGISVEQLKGNLSQWLELSLNEKIPPSLLLLSRTLYLPEETVFQDRLKVIISTLPDSVANEAKLKLAEIEGDKIDNKAKIELVRSIEQAIKNEREELKRLRTEEELRKAAELKAKKEKEAAAAALAVAAKETAMTELEAVASAVQKRKVEPIAAVLDDEVVSKKRKAKEEAAAEISDAEGAVHPKELREIEHILEKAKGHYEDEKDDLRELREDVDEYREDVAEARSLVLLKGGSIEESKAARRLQNSVDKIIGQTSKLVNQLHEKKLKLEAEQAKDIDVIGINELMLAIRRLQKVPDEAKSQKILQVLNALDDDHDGNINIDSALEVIELIGTENVKISPELMSKISGLLKKEDILESEEDKAEAAAAASAFARAKQSATQNTYEASAKTNNAIVTATATTTGATKDISKDSAAEKLKDPAKELGGDLERKSKSSNN